VESTLALTPPHHPSRPALRRRCAPEADTEEHRASVDDDPRMMYPGRPVRWRAVDATRPTARAWTRSSSPPSRRAGSSVRSGGRRLPISQTDRLGADGLWAACLQATRPRSRTANPNRARPELRCAPSRRLAPTETESLPGAPPAAPRVGGVHRVNAGRPGLCYHCRCSGSCAVRVPGFGRPCAWWRTVGRGGREPNG
jgi:hypothetical protein